jgi:hypothetical protein
VNRLLIALFAILQRYKKPAGSQGRIIENMLGLRDFMNLPLNGKCPAVARNIRLWIFGAQATAAA